LSWLKYRNLYNHNLEVLKYYEQKIEELS